MRRESAGHEATTTTGQAGSPASLERGYWVARAIEMMASTYSALKSHGISSKALMRAAKFNFEPKVANYSGLPDQSSKRFWSEFLACRLAFKRKTGFDIEKLIGD